MPQPWQPTSVLGFGTKRPSGQVRSLAKNLGCPGSPCSDIIPAMPPLIRVRAVVLDCPDPLALSGFYAELLGWPPDPEPSADNSWAELSSPIAASRLNFNESADTARRPGPRGSGPRCCS